MKVIAYIRNCLVPPVRKAVVAALVPQAPALISLVLREYGALAAFELTAVLTSAGVYKATNVPAGAPGPVVPAKS